MKRILFFVFWMVSQFFESDAQLLINNNTSITITAGAQLTVKGDILNATGTNITNDGIIDLSGNWINNSGSNCFGLSAGTVEMNGTTQSVGGTDETVFNNLFLTGGSKTLLIDATSGGAMMIPAGVLTLDNASLDLNSNRMLITNSSSAGISSTNGYILSEDTDHSSAVTWRINSASGNHVIPFGTATGEMIPFGVAITGGNAGDFKVSTYPTAPPNSPYPVTPTLVTHVRSIFGVDNSANTIDRFWETGTTGAPVATLTFTYAAGETAANGNSGVRAQRWSLPDSAWEYPLPGQFNPTIQSVSVPGATLFGPWALALENSPLPIELLDFSARVISGNRVLCEWQTATEINNDYFTIERSADGVNFENVGNVDGAGNSTSMLAYEYTDRDPYKGISWYRLKQTDFDGNYSHSEPKKIVILQQGQISVFPNPSNGIFYLQLKNDEAAGNMVFELFDMRGRKVYDNKLSTLPLDGTGNFQINAEHLLPAMYHFRISSSSGIEGQGRIEIISNLR